MKKQNIILEACVETLEQAINAEKNGANRIELCGDLSVGGVTPHLDLITKAKKNLSIPIMVMIRPRGGNFIYTKSEFDKMKKEIFYCKNLGIKGVVFGILDSENEVNFEQTAVLAELAFPMEVTFHKAIDEISNPIKSLHKLLNINNITRILTSGKSKTAVEGSDLIREMMVIAKDKITILPAGKITNKNLSEVHQLIGASEYHGRKIVGNLD